MSEKKAQATKEEPKQERALTVVESVRDMLSNDKMKQQLADALPNHLTPERMIRVSTTAIQTTPALMECSPRSLIACIVEASQLGLEPSGVLGHAYLVPYRNNKTKQKEAQLQVGYKGLIDLARRSGDIGKVTAEVVHETDLFQYAKGLEPKLVHIPSLTPDDPGPMIAAYATAHFKDDTGTTQFEVMTKREIDGIRARSKASTSGPWVTDYEAMAKKTVLRRLCKLLPCSVEIQTALGRDELRELGILKGKEFIDTTATETKQASKQATSLDDWMDAEDQAKEPAEEIVCAACGVIADKDSYKGFTEVDGNDYCEKCGPSDS